MTDERNVPLLGPNAFMKYNRSTFRNRAGGIWLLLTGLVTLSGIPRSHAGVDTITREIQCTNGIVWVDDNLHFSEELAGVQGELAYLYYDVKTNIGKGMNLTADVVALLSKESLMVQKAEAAYKDGWVDLHVRSQVKNEPGLPAKLHIVLSLGGLTADFDQWRTNPATIGQTHYMGGKIQNTMLVYQTNGMAVLWFPDLGDAEKDLKDVSSFEDQMETNIQDFKRIFNITNDQHYVCALNVNGQRTVLLDWFSGITTSKPDIALIRKMNDEHKMSENDLINLSTSVKIGKGGYYTLTNRIDR